MEELNSTTQEISEGLDIQEKDASLRKRVLLNVFSIILTVLAIASIFISLIVCDIYSVAIHPVVFTKGWLVGVSLPLPIASLVFGLYTKKKGYAFYKNIVVGIIFTFFVSVFTILFTILCVDDATHDDSAILRVEQSTSIDLPQHQYVSTYVDEESTKENLRVREKYHSTVYFDEETAEKFESELINDERWLKENTPNDLLGSMNAMRYDNSEEYNLIYNVTTGELNTPPNVSGEYDFIQMLYDIETNELEIYEYTLVYNK